MKKLKLLVSLPTDDNDFQLEQALSAQRAGTKLGIDVTVIYSDNDTVNQSTHILKAIQSRPESRPAGIILEPVRGSALPQVAQVACDAGIAWAVLNRAPDYISELRRKTKVPVFAVTSSHTEIGRIQGKQFAALLPQGGSILYLEGPANSSAAKERTAGMTRTKPANIQVKTIRANWTEQSAYRAVSSWLRLSTSQETRIDLVGAQDDSMAAGARKAFAEIVEGERERWLKIPFTGCDGLPKTG